MTIKKVFFTLVIITILAYGIQAKGAGSSVCPILKTGTGARAGALGNAYTGVSDDVNSIIWNPAGLAFLKTTEAALDYNSSFADINYKHLAFSTPLRILSVGGSIRYADYGQVEETLIAGSNYQKLNSTIEPKEMIVTLTGSKKLSDGFTLGSNLKYINLDYGDNKGTGVAVDFGFLYRPASFYNFQIGGAVRNLGTNITFISESEKLPFTIAVGSQYRMNSLPATLLFDISKPNDNDVSFNFGCEYEVKKMFNIRCGYMSNFDIGSGLTSGIGLIVGNFKLDYALNFANETDNIHKISLTMLFGKQDYKEVYKEKTKDYLEYTRKTTENDKLTYNNNEYQGLLLPKSAAIK